MNRATLWEISLAVVITMVIAAGPLTPNEWGPSIAIGLAVAGAVMAYRLWLRPAPAVEEGPAFRLSGEWVWQGLGWAIVVGLWLLAFTSTLRWLWWEWTRSVWVNDHGIFMPFIIGYLAYRNLRDDPDPRPESSAWGLPLLGAGLSLSLVDGVAATRYLGMAGLLLTLPAACLMLLGVRRTRMLAVPLALTLLMVPVPFTLSTHLYLRQITAWAVDHMMGWLQIPFVREGTSFELTSGLFVVSDACSGFSTLYGSLAIALVLVFLTRSPRRRLAILVCAPLLALAANTLRVLALTLMGHYVGVWTLDTALHEGTGVVAFFVVIVVLALLAREPELEEAT